MNILHFSFLLRVVLQTALHLAVIMEQPHIVEKLLKAGCDPRVVDRNGNTALHIACRRGSLTCFAVLTQINTQHLRSILSVPNYSGASFTGPFHTRISCKITPISPGFLTILFFLNYRTLVSAHSIPLWLPVAGRESCATGSRYKCQGLYFLYF